MTGDNRKPKPERRVRKIDRRPKAAPKDTRKAKPEKTGPRKAGRFVAWLRRLFTRRTPLTVQRVQATKRQRSEHNIGPLPSIEWSEPDRTGERIGYGADGNIYTAYPAKGYLGHGVTRVLRSGRVFYMGVYDIP